MFHRNNYYTLTIIVLELRSTERAEPTFHKGFYCIQKTGGYEGSEEHGRKKKCDMEKMMNKKSYFELVFAQHSSGSYVVLMKNNPERY